MTQQLKEDKLTSTGQNVHESAVLKEDQYEQERINIMSVLEEYIRETKIFENN